MSDSVCYSVCISLVLASNCRENRLEQLVSHLNTIPSRNFHFGCFLMSFCCLFHFNFSDSKSKIAFLLSFTYSYFGVYLYYSPAATRCHSGALIVKIIYSESKCLHFGEIHNHCFVINNLTKTDFLSSIDRMMHLLKIWVRDELLVSVFVEL